VVVRVAVIVIVPVRVAALGMGVAHHGDPR
jgi:hypothetical protein